MRGNQHSRQRKRSPILFLVLQLRCETIFTTVYRVSCTLYQILELFRETRAASGLLLQRSQWHPVTSGQM